MKSQGPIALIALILLLCGVSVPAQDVQQVQVSVKIVEFQTEKGVETGLSGYFQRRAQQRPFMRATSGNGSITSADLTFPASTNAGITVFLDRLSNQYGDVEVVLQGLVDENRASILAQPKAMVMVGQEVPTVIETTQRVPFEDTRVVGASAVQVVSFRDAGVRLSVRALGIADDDGNPMTKEDTYIQLLLETSVKEEGQRITVALDDTLAGADNLFGGGSNAIRVPEFVSREIQTTVWVRHGQVLVLGGLYRNTRNKDLSTLPWLTQGEDLLNSVIQRVSPLAMPQVPVSAGLGRQRSSEGRRELVFLVKAEQWQPSYTIDFAPEDDEGETAAETTPRKVVTDIIEDISNIPTGIGEAIQGEKPGGEVTRSLGGGE